MERIRELQSDCHGDQLIEHFGLCNADLNYIREAQKVIKVSSVQNPLSVQKKKWIASQGNNAVLEYCKANDILFIAYACLGGLQVRQKKLDFATKYPSLIKIAKDYGENFDCYSVCLAWVRKQAPNNILIITGHRRQSTLESTMNTAPLLETLLDSDDEKAISSLE